jgi:DNA-binding response OmpR family regulator
MGRGLEVDFHGELVYVRGGLSSLRNTFLRIPMSKHAKQSKKHAVLIIEDSLDFSNLLKFVIEDEGLEGVQFPVTEQDVVAWAKQYRPILILTDLALRRKDGLDYIKDLKADPVTKKIPIAIVSGRDLPHKEVLELQLQGVKYYRKGRADMNEIREEIRKAIPSHKEPESPEPAS